jgi:hypothetical protein
MVSAVLKRVWLVFVDHSIVGVWRNKRDADKAVRLRQQHAISNITHFVAGPYALQAGATVTERAPEWIARCTCGVIYRHERQWQTLQYVGVMDAAENGVVLELRNCVACGSTISRRSSLKKGAKKVKR